MEKTRLILIAESHRTDLDIWSHSIDGKRPFFSQTNKLDLEILFNPIVLRTTKTLWRFGHSECNRVNPEKQTGSHKSLFPL